MELYLAVAICISDVLGPFLTLRLFVAATLPVVSVSAFIFIGVISKRTKIVIMYLIPLLFILHLHFYLNILYIIGVLVVHIRLLNGIKNNKIRHIFTLDFIIKELY